MKKTLAVLFAVVALGLATAPAAQAKGCIKGAILGGIAGHYLHHHAVLGAMAGCAIGHHIAAQHDRDARAAHRGHN
ncbi:MAG: hypothetical protein WDM86_23060 [Rhizomicrobium sp.]